MACAGSSIDFADFPWAKSQDLLQGAQTQADGRHLAIVSPLQYIARWKMTKNVRQELSLLNFRGQKTFGPSAGDIREEKCTPSAYTFAIEAQMKRIQPASSTSFNRPKQSNTRNIKKLFLVSMPKLKLSALFMCTIIRARLLVYDIISDEYNK